MNQPITDERLAELSAMGEHDSTNGYVVHQLLDEITRLRALVKRQKGDGERLEWLLCDCNHRSFAVLSDGACDLGQFREAIDSARKAAGES